MALELFTRSNLFRVLNRWFLRADLPLKRQKSLWSAERRTDAAWDVARVSIFRCPLETKLLSEAPAIKSVSLDERFLVPRIQILVEPWPWILRTHMDLSRLKAALTQRSSHWSLCNTSFIPMWRNRLIFYKKRKLESCKCIYYMNVI